MLALYFFIIVTIQHYLLEYTMVLVLPCCPEEPPKVLLSISCNLPVWPVGMLKHSWYQCVHCVFVGTYHPYLISCACTGISGCGAVWCMYYTQSVALVTASVRLSLHTLNSQYRVLAPFTSITDCSLLWHVVIMRPTSFLRWQSCPFLSFSKTLSV